MRKIKDFVVSDEGRDKGKCFVITEMPVAKSEKWAIKALLALGRSGVEVPDDIFQAGMAGLIIVGISKLLHLNFSDAEPLLDEMLECVQRRPDPSHPDLLLPLGNEVEEVKTLVQLRAEVLALHTNFSLADIKSKLTVMSAEGRPSPDAKMSPRSSRRRSRQK